MHSVNPARLIREDKLTDQNISSGWKLEPSSFLPEDWARIHLALERASPQRGSTNRRHCLEAPCAEELSGVDPTISLFKLPLAKNVSNSTPMFQARKAVGPREAVSAQCRRNCPTYCRQLKPARERLLPKRPMKSGRCSVRLVIYTRSGSWRFEFCWLTATPICLS